MAKLIKERELITGIEYTKEYVWKDDVSSGFSFDCDEKGNIDCKYALKNIKLAKEKVKKGELLYYGIIKREYSYYTPAIYECHCGRKVEIDGDTRCKCGQWYNGFGQELNSDWVDNPSCYDEEISDLS